MKNLTFIRVKYYQMSKIEDHADRIKVRTDLEYEYRKEWHKILKDKCQICGNERGAHMTGRCKTPRDKQIFKDSDFRTIALIAAEEISDNPKI